MRVKLKGIASATATLSNGERANYFYAWRGGPRLVGEPGSPEFLAKIWTEEHVAAFMAVAPETLQRALVLALETGQRQGDLLMLPWSAFDGTWIRLRQSKTGRKVNVPVTRRLRAVLENTPRTSPVILTNGRGRPWQPNAFRKAWGVIGRKAGLHTDLTFHDLRGTAVTRLSEAECTPQEIATITGHSLRDVGAIMDRYSARTDKIAVAAIAKLERGAR
jgi:integrase